MYDIGYMECIIEEQKEKIETLKKQIQKMKCCENCAYWHKHVFCNCDEECNNYDKWKMKSD